MERLTEKRSGQNAIPLRQDGSNKWALCSAGMGYAPAQYLYGDHADRLAAYEDTGLEPEEIAEILEQHKGFKSAINDENNVPQVSWGRASELCRADKDGRAVVLPCKVGDTVYIPNITNCSRKVVPARVQGISITVSGRVLLRFGGFPFESAWGDECGKDWFLTSEEAEEAMKGGGACEE